MLYTWQNHQILILIVSGQRRIMGLLPVKDESKNARFGDRYRLAWYGFRRKEQLMDIIMAVKRGDNDSTTSDLFGTIVGELRTSGVDVLLVACTELSVMAGDLNTNIPVIDALDVLTEAIVAFARPVAEPVT